MPTRDFTDESGTHWTVWTTFPSGFHVLSQQYAQGWLTFESPTGTRRRLAPIPHGWELMLPAQLSALCHRAAPVRTHRLGFRDSPGPMPALGDSLDDSLDAGDGTPEQNA